MHPKYARLVRRSPEPQKASTPSVKRRGISLLRKPFFLKPKFLRRALGVLILLVAVSWSFHQWIPSSKAIAAPWSSNHGSYAQRKQLTLVNNSGQTFESGTTYKVTIDTASLYNSGSLLATCDDLRVVYQPSDTQAVELKRNVEYASSASGVTTCATSSATKVVFQLQANIANAGTDANYYIYYDNATATTYPAADALAAYNVGAKAATFVAPFNGTTQALAAGNGTPTTATGAIRYSGGKSAMSFDGKDDYVSAVCDTISGPFTIEFWVNAQDHTQNAGHGGIFGGVSGTDNGAVGIGVEWHTSFFYDIGNWNNSARKITTPAEFGVWTHLAATYDGTYFALFKNGVLVDRKQELNGVAPTISTCSIAAASSYYKGLVDEVRISNSVRYTSNFSPSIEPFVRDDNTYLLYHFDENGSDPRNANKAIDDSGRGKHGIIGGASYVSGLVGVNSSTTSNATTGYQASQSYAGHDGVFIEEGTTNKITNPSFDHTTYNTNWSATQTYTQEDQFTTARAGGAVNSTSAEPTGGTRTAIDTNSKISITGGQLSFATGEAANDGVWYPVQTRAAGKLLSATITPADTNGDILFGWDTNQTGAIADALKFTATGVLQIVPNGGTAVTVGSYTATSYQVASVMRATGIYWFIKGGTYTTWTQLFSTSAGSANMYPAIQAGNTTAIFTLDNMRIPTATWLPTPLAYDSFTRANGAIGSTETIGPDSQTTPQLAWTGSTWTVSGNTAINTPNLGAEAETDPGLEGTYTSGLSASLYQQYASVVAQSSDTHGGSKAQQYYGLGVNYSLFQNSSKLALTNNVWYRGSIWGKRIVNNGSGVNSLMYTGGFMPAGQAAYYFGSSSYTQYSRSVRVTNSSNFKLDWLISGGNPSDEIIVDDLSMKPLTLSELFSSISTSKSDIVASINTTRHSVNTAELSGLVVKLDSAANPQNFLLAYTYSGVNAAWHMTILEKCVNGTYTTLINSNAVGYSAGAPLRVVTNGSSVSLYYNNIQVGTTQTVSDAGIVNNTLHGTFSTYEGNTLDNFTLYPLGNGGENASIPVEPTEFLTATENSTAPYYKFGSKSVKLVDATNATQYATSINPGNTNTHTLSAYVYDGTTGNIGGTVSSSIAKLVFNGATVTPAAYTDMGGGWWRLTYSAAAMNATAIYGVEVQAGKTIYVDGVQLEEKAYATTYTDGTMGTGYAWTGTANDSTSTRTVANLQYSATNNISNVQGTYSFWAKPIILNGWNVLFNITPDPGCSYLNLVASPGNGGMILYDSCSNQIVKSNSSWVADKWNHFVVAWGANYMNLFINGVASTASNTFNQRTMTNMIVGGTGTADSSMSDLRIFNNTLTSTEITDLYNAGLGSHSSLAPVATERYTDGEPPVLAWHLNEGYGTTAYDTTIYQNSGTISGPTWSDDQAGGGGGKSLKFDGINDYISRAYTNDTELSPGTSAFSVSTWFKHPSTVTGTDTLISRYSSTGSGGGYKVYMNSSGYICFGVDDDATWSPDDFACTTVSYADSTWHHILAIKGTSTIAVYIDGTQKASTAFTVSSSLSGSSPTFYTGIDSDGTSNPWDGFIDEVRVYNSARSEEQINQEYIAKGTNKGVSAQFGSGGAGDTLTKGLVGHWKMDEASWNGTAGEVLDASGNGSHGSAVSSATTGVGKFGNGGTFNGNGQNVNIPVRMINETNPTFSYSFWVKATNTGNSSQDILAQARGGINNNASYEVSYILGSNNICITDGSGSSINCYSKNLSSWTHIGIINDYRNSTYKLFINGELAIRSNTPAGLPIQGLSAQFKIGDHPYSPYNHGFSGSLDDVRIYNRALSPVEVRALYEYAPSPVAHYTFDEGSGQSAYDKSGNGNTGTLGASASPASDDPQWTNGKYGKALSFDGADDYVDVVDSDIYRPTKALTVSAWIKAPAQSDYKRIISTNSTANVGYDIHLFPSGAQGKIQFDIGTGSQNSLVSTTTGLGDNKWHYVSGTWDGQTMKLYIDGNQEASGNLTGTITYSSAYLALGSTGSFGSLYNGSIDDVRIYNYARTQKQIVSDMNAGHPAVGSPVGSAVAHYKFNEGADNTCSGGVNDACNSGNGGPSLDGAQSGMAVPAISTSGWTNNGISKKALSYDGNDDYISVSDNNSIDLGVDDFTLSVWVYPTKNSPSNKEWPYLSKTVGNANNGYLLEASSWGTNGNEISLGCYFTLASVSYQSCGGYKSQLNAWTHVVIVRKSDTVWTYHNGIYKGRTTNSSLANNVANAAPLKIGGQDVWGAGSLYQGAIDELKIYNYALSEDEVKLEYNAGKAIVMGSLGTATDGKTGSYSQSRAYCPPGNVEGNCAAGQNPAPIGEWNFDSGSGTSATDTSGNNNTGALTNGPTWQSGKQGKALSFDRVDDYVNITQTSQLKLVNTSYTLSAWFNTSVIPGNTWPSDDYIISNRDTNSPYKSWSLGIRNNPIRLATGTTEAGVTGNTDISINRWYHVTSVYDSGAQTLRLYLNGREDGYASSIPANVNTNGTYLAIGRDPENMVYLFGGLIDQVKIYNYARTPAQIAWDYNKGAPLVQYKFNECSGSAINNSVPSANGEESGNNGTLIIGATLPQTSAGTCSSGNTAEAWNNGTIGKLSSSVSFDGVDDYVSLGTSLNQSGDRSVFAWIKRSAIGAAHTILSNNAAGSGYPQFYIRSSTNKLITHNGTGFVESNTALTSTDTWYHVGITVSGSTITFYLNGKVDGTGTLAIPTFSSTSSIGRSEFPGDYFAGQIDDARIYNYALSPVQVRDVYNNGAVSFK